MRQIVRSREFLVKQRAQIKRHILSMCRCFGIDYRRSIKSPQANYFTKKHLIWLRALPTDEVTTATLKQFLDTVETFNNQIAIADKCMQRLSLKAAKLRFRQKHHNKIKVACARELLGFVWHSLQEKAA